MKRLLWIGAALLAVVSLGAWTAIGPSGTRSTQPPRAATGAARVSTGQIQPLASMSVPAPEAGRAKRRIGARDGDAEARLIEVYRLISQADTRQALAQAGQLVAEYPHFQLAQLVYGDLLASQTRPLRMLGDVPDTAARSGAMQLANLREESMQRLRALVERPPEGAVPGEFLQLAPRVRHAIAIDTSRSRLYLFENGADGLQLVADYYMSVGLRGTGKYVEGDQRTPLGIYYITSSLDPRSLKPLYGAGALPINYPNPLDLARGKTGSGIWLHGTPPEQFARAPKASDGCLVLANPDLQRILSTVAVRVTPVLIAQHLNWVAPENLRTDGDGFVAAFDAWQSARAGGDMNLVLAFYTANFKSFDKNLRQYTQQLRREVARLRGVRAEAKDLSYLRWTDAGADIMVVTFGDAVDGGATKRQYWSRQDGQWKIFFEGNIG